MNNWFNVPTAQTPIFVLFLSAGVLFDVVFSLWVSLAYSYHTNESKKALIWIMAVVFFDLKIFRVGNSWQNKDLWKIKLKSVVKAHHIHAQQMFEKLDPDSKP